MTRYAFDKPSKSGFKKFWSVFEAQQAQKKQQLAQQQKDKYGEAKA
jgi:hypothetical protein